MTENYKLLWDGSITYEQLIDLFRTNFTVNSNRHFLLDSEGSAFEDIMQ